MQPKRTPMLWLLQQKKNRHTALAGDGSQHTFRLWRMGWGH